MITLTTDFGEGSAYVAAMKGVILSIHPGAAVLDLSHSIPPQDVQAAAWFLAEAIPFFPPGGLHVVVVDPGVGTSRALLYVEVDGRRLLAPDNGVWTWLAARCTVGRVIRLQDPSFWRQPVSATFHGRDILAPVAARLSLGLSPSELGPPAESWVTLDWPLPRRQGGMVHGQVIHVDRFGNLITNIGQAELAREVIRRVEVEGTSVDLVVRTYGDSQPGKLVALFSSTGMLEVALVEGSAAGRLGIRRGAQVAVSLA